jgi:hypothetical protein
VNSLIASQPVPPFTSAPGASHSLRQVLPTDMHGMTLADMHGSTSTAAGPSLPISATDGPFRRVFDTRLAVRDWRAERPDLGAFSRGRFDVGYTADRRVGVRSFGRWRGLSAVPGSGIRWCAAGKNRQ